MRSERLESGTQVLRDMGERGAQPVRRLLYASWAIPVGAFTSLPMWARYVLVIWFSAAMGLVFSEYGSIVVAKQVAVLAVGFPAVVFFSLAGGNVVTWWENKR